MSIAWAWLIGLLFGVRHATDADHVVTIATILKAQDGLRGALRTAILWGLGHTSTFLAVGGSVVLFDLKLPSAFEQGTELAVATLLVGLGLAHFIQPKELPTLPEPEAAALRSRRGWRPLAAGLVHGLAGSAGIALLALTTIPSTLGALLYLAFFGVGTMVGMSLLTLALACPMQWSLQRGGRLVSHITSVAALASIALGISLGMSALEAPEATSEVPRGGIYKPA